MGPALPIPWVSGVGFPVGYCRASAEANVKVSKISKLNKMYIILSLHLIFLLLFYFIETDHLQYVWSNFFNFSSLILSYSSNKD